MEKVWRPFFWFGSAALLLHLTAAQSGALEKERGIL
jgi:hypothetical protein